MAFIAFTICMLLVIRIGFIQFVQGSELQAMAYTQQTLNRKINPKRRIAHFFVQFYGKLHIFLCSFAHPFSDNKAYQA